MKSVILRYLIKEDKPFVFELLQNKNVMKFIGPKRRLNDAEVEEWFKEEFNKPSRFVIASKKSNEFIGMCGVKKIDDKLDFGFYFRECFWKQGIATEACKKALKEIKKNHDLSQLHIFIATHNKGSVALAKKLGWIPIKDVTENEDAGKLYKVIM